MPYNVSALNHSSSYMATNLQYVVCLSRAINTLRKCHEVTFVFIVLTKKNQTEMGLIGEEFTEKLKCDFKTKNFLAHWQASTITAFITSCCNIVGEKSSAVVTGLISHGSQMESGPCVCVIPVLFHFHSLDDRLN